MTTTARRCSSQLPLIRITAQQTSVPATAAAAGCDAPGRRLQSRSVLNVANPVAKTNVATPPMPVANHSHK